jgi:GntR family transcriptional regulator
VPSSRILERIIRPSSPAEATELRIAPHEPVVHLRRLRLADEVPMAIESTILVRSCGPAVMAADLSHGSLHEALHRAGIVLRRGASTIGAANATHADARLLGLRAGGALIVERRVIADGHGRRVEATESRYRADRYALDVRFDVDGPDPL